jgi:hypothetical protein
MSEEGDKTGFLSKAWANAYLLALPYLVGYVVVTIHLAKFGILPLDVISLQYVTAGIWSILPLIIIFYPLLGLATALHDQYKRGESTPKLSRSTLLSHVLKIGFALFITYGWCVILVGLFRWVAGELIDNISLALTIRDILKFLGITLIFALAIAFCAFYAWLFLRDVKISDFHSSFNDLVWGLNFGFFLCAVFLCYIFYFATNMYGEIPAYLGGGAPVPISIHLKQQKISNSSPETGPIPSGRYYLLTTTEHSFYVSSMQGRHAIEISREVVEEVEYGLPPESQQDKEQKKDAAEK